MTNKGRCFKLKLCHLHCFIQLAKFTFIVVNVPYCLYVLLLYVLLPLQKRAVYIDFSIFSANCPFKRLHRNLYTCRVFMQNMSLKVTNNYSYQIYLIE